MKINEVPEKLYISYMGYGCFNDDSSTTRINKSQTEYTRTDAFIEKAEKYFTEKFIKDVSVLAGGPVHINFDAAFSNFIKYMKGE